MSNSPKHSLLLIHLGCTDGYNSYEDYVAISFTISLKIKVSVSHHRLHSLYGRHYPKSFIVIKKKKKKKEPK